MTHNVYSASFTTGALLLSETEAVVNFLKEHVQTEINLLTDTNELLHINSRIARKKKVGEILKRYNAVSESYWKAYLQLATKEERNIFLYFVCLSAYPLIRDFHLEVVLSKWRRLDTTIDRSDVLRFLNWSSGNHPEIDKWTDNTKFKACQIMILMMKETGFINNGKLISVYLSDELCRFFAHHGEAWFLEAMFIPKEHRERILNSL
ncbi:MAG: BrxA family protein [Bacteroidota bacterium]